MALSKSITTLELLDKGIVYLHLDSRKAGVDVPPWLKHQACLCLSIGYNMAVPIPDLIISDWGVHATLSFSGTAHLCRIPWSAVYAVLGDKDLYGGGLWPEYMPPIAPHKDLLVKATTKGLRAIEGSGKSSGKARGHLRLVK